MARLLDDGTCIPSYLSVRDRGVTTDTGNFNNIALRIGEVKEKVAPNSDKSLSKKYWEYTVEVQHRDGTEAAVSTRYTNCLLANLFGSGSDLERFTLRTDDQNNRKEDGVGVGAKVLLLCANGENTRTYIIGGVRDPETDGTKDVVDDGHNWFREFNGVRQTIKKDGEYKLLFRGATKVNGDLANGVKEEDGGAALTFAADGSVLLNDGDKGKEKLAFNKNDKKATLSSGGTMLLEAPDGIVAQTDQSIDLKAAKVHIGSANANEALIMGTTYRDQQKALHDSLSNNLQTMMSLFTTMATTMGVSGGSMASAGVANAVPITGGAAAATFFASAAAAMISMASTLGSLASQAASMMAAIKKFEALSSQYISNKNFADHG